MYAIPNISSDPIQAINLVLPDGENTAKVTLRYLENDQAWYMDLEYQATIINGLRVCSNPNLLRQWRKILPFGLGCFTLDNSDPYFIDDFTTGRCGLLLLSQAEVDNFETLLSELKDEAE